MRQTLVDHKARTPSQIHSQNCVRKRGAVRSFLRATPRMIQASGRITTGVEGKFLESILTTAGENGRQIVLMKSRMKNTERMRKESTSRKQIREEEK